MINDELKSILQLNQKMDRFKFRVIVIYKGPITKELQYREAAFVNYTEAIVWLDEICQVYIENNIVYSAYINDEYIRGS